MKVRTKNKVLTGITIAAMTVFMLASVIIGGLVETTGGIETAAVPIWIASLAWMILFFSVNADKM